jgi:hypothetical protein
MIVLPICVFVRPRSSLTTAINGAIPNHPKKQRKNANHVIWNARICGVLRLNRLIRVALFFISIFLASLEHLVISYLSLLAIPVPDDYKRCASANQSE